MLGVISIARPGRPFSERQRELFAYLANQAAISIENVDLHETIQRQAVTDELTGLFNHRRFQEVMSVGGGAHAALRPGAGPDHARHRQLQARQRHLRPPPGRHGPARGRRVLRESSREIDEPARYGGEEMAVALPQTGLQGAYEFAERVRHRIEALQLPLLEGEGHAARSPLPSAPRRCRTPPRSTRTRSSRRPTPRCTAPSARARTAPSRPSRLLEV